MTVPATTRRSPVYSGNGVTLVFPFSFKVFLPTDIQVIVTSVGGAIAPATYITDYSVTLNPDQTVAPGGSISYQPGFVPLPTGAKLVIIGNLPYSQTLALPGGGNFNPVAIENNFDRTEMQIQQLASGLDATISVPVGETVPPLPAAAVRAGYVLGFDSLGNPVATIPTSGAVGTLVTDLANSVAPSKGAGQIGFGYALAYGAGTVGKWLKDLATTAGAGFIGVLDTANYFNAATLEAVLAEIGNPKGQLQGDGVNVLRYIPPAEWAAITAYTSSTNLYTYLQAALTAEPNLLFPDGLFITGTKLVPRTDAKIRGMRRRGTFLRGSAANLILEFGINTQDAMVQNIRFQGTGCTGIAVANTAGAFHDYLIRPHIFENDFDWDLAYGINADLIFSVIERNTFAYYGVAAQPAPGASTMVAIRSHSVTGNLTNQNVIRNNIFLSCGSISQASIDIDGGSNWVLESNDFEQGGAALAANNIQLLEFTGKNWIEGCVATNGLITVGACITPAVLTGINFTNNTCRSAIQWVSGATAGLDIHHNTFGLNSPSYPIFDATTLAATLPADGSISFYRNYVAGGNAANKCVTGTDFRGGATQPRMTGRANSVGPVNNANSDPGVVVTRNGVGDISVTASQPFGTSTSTIRVAATGTACIVRASIVSTVQIRFTTFAIDGTNGAAEDTINFAVYGS